MKTITKTFYVNDSCMEDLKNNRSFDYRYFSTSQSMDNENQIQISWQEPEREVTIKESELDEYIKDFFKPGANGEPSPMQSGVKMQTHLKQKLFGASDE